MSQIINFKKSPYFVFKQNLYASNSGIALHSKESFDLNGESTWSDPSGFKEDGYVLFMSEGLGETKCDLFYQDSMHYFEGIQQEWKLVEPYLFQNSITIFDDLALKGVRLFKFWFEKMCNKAKWH